jgi:heterotetrameric sarcosine oxidase delta subunit
VSFLLPCPNCGPRDVNEQAPSLRELTSYLYIRRNVAGLQREWWCHRYGCRLWFQAERDTRTNEVQGVIVPGTRQESREE